MQEGTRARVNIPEGTVNRWSRWNGREGTAVGGDFGLELEDGSFIDCPDRFLEAVDDAGEEEALAVDEDA